MGLSEGLEQELSTPTNSETGVKTVRKRLKPKVNQA